MGVVKKSCQELAIDLGFLIGFCLFLFKQASYRKTQKLQRASFQVSMPVPPTYYIQAFNPFHSIEGFIQLIAATHVYASINIYAQLPSI